MLRHYDKIGIFKPSYIEQNGYRYYSDDDMYKISSIKQLRSYEFSLQEIDQMIHKNDTEYTKLMFLQKMEQLKYSATECHYLIMEMEKQMKALKGTDHILNANKQFDILIGYRNAFLAISQRKHINENQIDPMIDELYQAIDDNENMIATGTHMAIFHQSYNIYNPDDTDIEACIPVNCEITEGPFPTRIIDGGWYMSTIFMGSYDIIGNAYIALFKWAKENHYSMIGPTIEKYYKDCKYCQEMNSQDNYITEICIPVNHD